MNATITFRIPISDISHDEAKILADITKEALIIRQNHYVLQIDPDLEAPDIDAAEAWAWQHWTEVVRDDVRGRLGQEKCDIIEEAIEIDVVGCDEEMEAA